MEFFVRVFFFSHTEMQFVKIGKIFIYYGRTFQSMNNNDSLKISLLLGTIIIIGIIVLVNNNNIYARQAIWRDFDNMKDFVSAIRNREINDDSINWEKVLL